MIFATLEVESGGYVDPELSARFSDLVYRVTVGTTALRIYVLFEHQSRPDPDMAFRLLPKPRRRAGWRAERRAFAPRCASR